MLTRIYIDNFRSFVNFEYRPGKKQLLIGPNGSGKSSLFEVIRRLKDFVGGEGNGFEPSTCTRWQKQQLQTIELSADLDEKRFEYRIEVNHESTTDGPFVQLERLSVSGNTVFELSNGLLRFFHKDSESGAVPIKTNRSSLYLAELSNPDVRRFTDWFQQNVHCMSIDVYPNKMDEAAESEEVDPDFELENLAGWYRHLVQTFPEENARFLKSLKECIDGFVTLRFSSEDDRSKTLRAEFRAPATKSVAYSISELSEGQRSLIALYMVLHFLIHRGDTVFLDEPDNFISLREIQPWLRDAEDAVDENNGQLILISHHPEILDHWAMQYGLRFFREENGHVRTERFQPDQDGKLQPSELIARGWA